MANSFALYENDTIFEFQRSIFPHRFSSIRFLTLHWQFRHQSTFAPPVTGVSIKTPWDLASWHRACSVVSTSMPGLREILIVVKGPFHTVSPSLRAEAPSHLRSQNHLSCFDEFIFCNNFSQPEAFTYIKILLISQSLGSFHRERFTSSHDQTQRASDGVWSTLGTCPDLSPGETWSRDILLVSLHFRRWSKDNWGAKGSYSRRFLE
jgi:hypothetical protein